MCLPVDIWMLYVQEIGEGYDEYDVEWIYLAQIVRKEAGGKGSQKIPGNTCEIPPSTPCFLQSALYVILFLGALHVSVSYGMISNRRLSGSGHGDF